MHDLTGGLLGPRDPAQPLLTYVDGPARVELSGATTANWVAKTANLLVDGFGAPDRVGLLLPLHWQTACLLLGGVAAGATVVVAADPGELAGCAVAFTDAASAEAALDAGVDDVLACSLTPFATRLASVPPLVLDAAVELPAYGDRFGGR
ncbi:MAG: TIGR03089 family protein, partial [Mycobacteriales bacterium]